MKFKVLIVGCGKIAGGFDEFTSSKHDFPLTHAKAYAKNPHFEVVACVDPCVSRRRDFQDFWGIKYGFSNILEVVKIGFQIDIVSICSPTSFHKKHLDEALLLQPKLVFCEKPLHESSEEASILVSKFKERNVGLMVNYSRRFDKSIISFKEAIDSNKYGRLRTVLGVYNKGLLNNGSHILDLLFYLLGSLSVEYVGIPVFDFTPEDPSFPLNLATIDEIPISLSCSNSHDFQLIELDFVFSNARIKLLDGGLRWSVQRVVDSQYFAGYKGLSPEVISEGTYLKAFENALTNIYDYLCADADLTCSGRDALNILKLCSEIKTRVL